MGQTVKAILVECVQGWKNKEIIPKNGTHRTRISGALAHIDTCVVQGYDINICFENPGKCAIGLVYEGDKPISSEFFLISEDTIFSFLGGTDSGYFKLRPNEFLKINAINWARKHELIYYMIGGGLSNKEDDNLYLYKKKYFQTDEDIKFFTGRKIVQSKKYLELLIKSGKKDNVNMTLPDIRQGFFPGYR